jgi:hypothetical protein
MSQLSFNYHQLSCHFYPLILNYRFSVIIQPIFTIKLTFCSFPTRRPEYLSFTIGSFRASSLVIRKRPHNSSIECEGNHVTSRNRQINIEHGWYIGDAMFVSVVYSYISTWTKLIWPLCFWGPKERLTSFC